MPAWTAFAGLAGVVLVLLLALARLTQSRVSDAVTAREDAADSQADDAATSNVDGQNSSQVDDAAASTAASPPSAPAPSAPESGSSAEDPVDEWQWGPDAEWAPPDATTASREHAARPAARLEPGHPSGPAEPSLADLPNAALLVNVALSQALFGAVLALGAWWAEVPPVALGLAPVASPDLLWLGVALGGALWVGNELAGRAGARFGVDGGEELRALLAPESAGGWVLLLAGVLPLVALVEELLFRATLVGALAAGFGLPAWALVVGSSVAFALGHGAQGRVGMLVTGAFGLALGAAFVATGSLFVVVVAHYLVNALEFVVHEGFGRGMA